MMSEERILKKLSDLNWKIIHQDNNYIVFYNLKKDFRIFVYPKKKVISFHDRVTWKVYDLFHQLMVAWGWKKQ